MSNGAVKAAVSSFLTDSVIPEASSRGMAANDDVEKFLQESFITEDEFDTFAEGLYKQIENNVSTIASRNSSAARPLLREKMMASFHIIFRQEYFPDIWESYFKKINRERFDPLVEQHVNKEIFESLVEARIPPTASTETEQ